MSTTVAVFIPLPPVVRSTLESAGLTLRCLDDLGSREAVVHHSEVARIVVANGEGGLSAAEIAGLPNLEIVCAIGVGYEAIDLDALASRGIGLTNGRGTNDTAVADHTFGIMLAIAGGIVPADQMVRNGDWGAFAAGGADYPFLARRRGVFGKRLGIVGLGRIGTKVAERGHRGFAMDVGYHNRRANAALPYRFFDSTEALAKWADFLVLAAPGGPATQHMVDHDVLMALGPEGFLINSGRGSLVDTQALIESLERGGICGAALDVVEGEPRIPAELLALGNVVLTPHMAGRGPEPVVVMADLLLDNIQAFLSGKPVLTPIDVRSAAS